MIRYLHPKNIIEAGLGFSTAVALNTNQYYFNNKINLTCIEPYPKLLKSLLNRDDSLTIKETKIQEVSLSEFQKLNENDDILFIDTSHISKVGSDVNYIIHEILPSLKSGVYIHIHDIHYPFEYRKDFFIKDFIGTKHIF